MDNRQYITEDRISIRDVVLRIRRLIFFLISQWKVIAIGTFIIAGIRIIYNVVRDPVFTAETTFILEGSGEKMNKLSSLASDFIPSGSSLMKDDDLFDTDHIIELYLSFRMLKETFLTEMEFEGKTERLITRWARNTEYDEKWARQKELKDLSFEVPISEMGVKHDSLLMEVIDRFKDKQLSVDKKDRKLSILSIQVFDEDKLFAKGFNQTLVGRANEFYRLTKTRKSEDNLRILQVQADSVRKVLNESLTKMAMESEQQPNPNPLYYSSHVTNQRLQLDIEASAAVYEELVKNLEIAKVTHRNNRPLIQIIDEPVLPLVSDKDRPLKLIVISLFLGGVLTTMGVIIHKTYLNIIDEG